MFAGKAKLTVFAAAATLAFAATASAQDDGGAFAPDAVVASQPSGVDLAKQYFVAIDFETQLGVILTRLTTPEQLGARKALTSSEREAIVSSAAEAMDDAMPLLIDEAARITASTFTADQLRDMIAFYSSDSGKAIAEKTSVLPPMASQLVLSFAPIIRADIVMRACAKMDCDAQPPVKA